MIRSCYHSVNRNKQSLATYNIDTRVAVQKQKQFLIQSKKKFEARILIIYLNDAIDK